MRKLPPSGVIFPEGWHKAVLDNSHPRRSFCSGQVEVDKWLKSSALQSQKKHLTVTKLLLDNTGTIVGYYTLATAQADFSDLPHELTKNLPRRQLPVAVIAWFGISRQFQKRGLGKRLLATVLRDCFEATQTFAFVAVGLDCVDKGAKRFYQNFKFQELPGYPMRLYLSTKMLNLMMTA